MRHACSVHLRWAIERPESMPPYPWRGGALFSGLQGSVSAEPRDPGFPDPPNASTSARQPALSDAKPRPTAGLRTSQVEPRSLLVRNCLRSGLG